MTTKKKKSRFGDQLRKTMRDERGDLDERFERADVALGSSSSRKEGSPKTHRKKVVRDTFSMPENDYALIEEIRERLIKDHAIVRNKSEILRAGLKVLQTLNSGELLDAAEKVELLKPGRRPK